jgi:hypothetical protein
VDGRWVLVALVVAVVAAIRWRRHAPDESQDDGLDHRDASERRTGAADARNSQITHDAVEPMDGSLHEALERVWAEHAHDAETLLFARLHQLVQRGVPVRAIRRAPGGAVVRVVFADNTVVLCQGTGTGDFGRLGLAMHRSAVRLGGYVHEEYGTRLEFRWNPDQRLAAVAVGLDQPD